jgi:nucleoside diphosphate kinase
MIKTMKQQQLEQENADLKAKLANLRILIHREGGNIQQIIATQPIKVVVVDDPDSISEGDDIIYETNPDDIKEVGTFYELFSMEYADTREIHDELKRLHI